MAFRAARFATALAAVDATRHRKNRRSRPEIGRNIIPFNARRHLAMPANEHIPNVQFCKILA
jgi:hypothetical protein